MTVIDLRAERRRRQNDRAEFNARVIAETRDELAAIEREAERGFVAAGSVSATDPDLGYVIHRGVLRRVRALVRKSARERQADAETVARLVETAERIYHNHLIDLANRRILDAIGGAQ